MGGREVPGNLVLSGSTTRQFPKNQQLSGEAAEAEQGRDQTTTTERLIGNSSSSQGHGELPWRQGSTAEPDVATRLLQAPELRAGPAHSMQAPRAPFVTVPTRFAPGGVMCVRYSRDEDVPCAGEHRLVPLQALVEKVAPR